MTTYAKAVQRFKRIERVALFPRRCSRCAIDFTTKDRVSVLENAIGLPLVMHEECAGRHRRCDGERKESTRWPTRNQSPASTGCTDGRNGLSR